MDIQVGATMLQNELSLLKVIVGVGFLGWMMLMFVQVILLDKPGPSGKVVSLRSAKKHEKKEILKKAA